jgi:hypothetical protein
VVWVALGLWVALEVHDLGGLSGSVKTVGGAVVEAGEAITELRDVPVVGDSVSGPGAPIREAGRQAQVTADEARGSANRLAILLGLAVAIIPSAPLLAIRFTRLGCRCPEPPGA